MHVDHVLIACRDIDVTATRLLAGHGLGSTDGGEHPQWGTGNRIVPAGKQYLELFGIRDRAVAAESPVGGWLAAKAAAGDRLAVVALGVEDLDAVCARLGIEAAPGRRDLPDGTALTWRLAGMDAALAHGLPFFIAWDGEGGVRERPTDGNAATGLSSVALRGDVDRLHAWIGSDVPGLQLEPGAPGIREVVVTTEAGPVVLPELL